LLLRSEAPAIGAPLGPSGDTLFAVTAGANWFVNPNVRLQLNGVMTQLNGPSPIQGFSDAR